MAKCDHNFTGAAQKQVIFFIFSSCCSIDNLLIDYQFTFSLLQEDDHYYTAINFMAQPEQVGQTS